MNHSLRARKHIFGFLLFISFSLIGLAQPIATDVKLTTDGPPVVGMGTSLIVSYNYVDFFLKEKDSYILWFSADDKYGSNKRPFIGGPMLKQIPISNDLLGRYISCEVTPKNASGAGAIVSSNTIQVFGLPAVKDVRILEKAPHLSGNKLNGEYEFVDGGAGDCGQSSYAWYVSEYSSGLDSKKILENNISFSVPNSYQGLYISFEVTPIDCWLQKGTPVESEWELINTPPNARDYTLEISEGDTVKIRISDIFGTLEDEDRHKLVFTDFEQGKFGKVVQLAEDELEYRHSGIEESYDEFTYVVSDGFEEDKGTIKLKVEVVNDSPLVTDKEYNLMEGDVIKVDAEEGLLVGASDDEDDKITVELVNKPEFGEIELSSDGSFVYEHGGTEEAYDKFSFRGFDGNSYGKPATAILNLIPVNDPPVAEDVVVVATQFFVGATLTGKYTYSDAEDDAEGESAYQWYFADNSSGIDAQMMDENSLNFIPVIAHAGGYVAFEVIPVDQSGDIGDPAISDYYYINDVPEANQLEVVNTSNPGVIAPGEEISADFTFLDPDDDPAGSHNYQWYRSSTSDWSDAQKVAGATGKQFTVRQEDKDYYLGFEVTPLASAGSSPGDIEKSLLYQVGKLPTAVLSGDAEVCLGTEAFVSVLLTGLPPWDIQYRRVGGATVEVNEIQEGENPYQIELTQAGTYEMVSVSDSKYNDGKVSGEATVTFHDIPSATVSGDIQICEGDNSSHSFSVNLTGESPWSISYSIDGGAPVKINTINSSPYQLEIDNNSLGEYTITSVVDDNKCQGMGTGSVLVEQKTSPVALLNEDVFACKGESTNFLIPINGSGPWVLRYSINGGSEISKDIPIGTQEYILSATVVGEYQLTYFEDSENEGCASGSASFSYYETPTATMGEDISLCYGATTSINVVLTGTAPWSFELKRNNEVILEKQDITSSLFSSIQGENGEYTVSSLSDKNNCLGTSSGAQVIDTITPPKVQILGLNEAYSEEVFKVPFSVSPEKEINSFEIFDYFGESTEDALYAIWSKNGQLEFSPDRAGKDNSPHMIRYKYQDPNTLCWGYDSTVIKVLEDIGELKVPEIYGGLNGIYCSNSDSILVEGANINNSQGRFEFSNTDERAIRIIGDTAIIYPKYISSRTETLTYIFEGGKVEKKFTFEDVKADFNWVTDCFVESSKISFSDNSYADSEIDSIRWHFYDIEKFVYDTNKVEMGFPELNDYSISYRIETENGCVDDTLKTILLKPTYTLGEDAYYEGFEGGKNFWEGFSDLKGGPVSWNYGLSPDGDFNAETRKDSVWYTNISDYKAQENSFVLSPCFDFSSLQRPMVSLDIFRDFESGRDGAVLQYKVGNSSEWKKVGLSDFGKNWYDNLEIAGKPGGNDDGWSRTGQEWENARHSLDVLIGEKNVRFRLAYGSDGTSTKSFKGFAFDNVWIGERGKLILIEHFVNSSDEKSKTENELFNANIEKFPDDVVNIQYHTAFPGEDLFYAESALDVESRLLFYGIQQVPYSIIDGGQDKFDYDDPDQRLLLKDIMRSMLEDHSFDIAINASLSGNNLLIDAELIALHAKPEFDMNLKVAIIEEQVDNLKGLNGETVFKNVFKAMVPGPQGVFISKSWKKNEKVVENLTWEINSVYDKKNIRVVAFLEEEGTEEGSVLQATIHDPSALLPNENVLGREPLITMAPNPASTYVDLGVSESILSKCQMKLFSSAGQLVFKQFLNEGDLFHRLDLSGYQKGVYMVQLFEGEQLISTEKLVVL